MRHDQEDTVKTPGLTLDFRVPFTAMVTVAVVIGTGLVGMYYKLDNVAESVIQLKSDVKASNSQTIEYARKQAVMEFRLEKLEDRKKE